MTKQQRLPPANPVDGGEELAVTTSGTWVSPSPTGTHTEAEVTQPPPLRLPSPVESSQVPLTSTGASREAGSRNCAVQGCAGTYYCRDLCRKHYLRRQRRGSTDYVKPAFNKRNTVERILLRIGPKTNSGCWEWQGYINSRGYGRVGFEGKSVLVHRHRRTHPRKSSDRPPLPEPCCCNPDHMEPVTSAENTRRGDHTNSGIRKREQTSCTHGHEFTEDNTYRRPDGRRLCRTCARVSDKARRGPGRRSVVIDMEEAA